MTTLEPSVFGQIRLEDMSRSELLTKTVLPLIQRACSLSDGRYTVENVVDGLMRGAFTLWGVMQPPAKLQAVAVTHVEAYPSGVRAFQILLLGSPSFEDLSHLFRFLPQMKAEAHRSGCAKIALMGKRSWERALPSDWRAAATVYECDLTA